ncbi:MAG TPA: four helix bundle protein [Terriglobales bacterium]|nr:four helix bundle protein [Terriglobales bacterium]
MFPAISPRASHDSSKRDFRHFLRASRGSLAELETQMLIARRLRYTDQALADTILSTIDDGQPHSQRSHQLNLRPNRYLMGTLGTWYSVLATRC